MRLGKEVEDGDAEGPGGGDSACDDDGLAVLGQAGIGFLPGGEVAVDDLVEDSAVVCVLGVVASAGLDLLDLLLYALRIY